MTEEVTVIDPRSGQRREPYPVDLDGWQRLVGGYIELVRTPIAGVLLVVHEEGVREGLPLNHWASVIAAQRIVGPVVVIDGPAFKRWKREEQGHR
jgi:hypothetical protein